MLTDRVRNRKWQFHDDEHGKRVSGNVDEPHVGGEKNDVSDSYSQVGNSSLDTNPAESEYTGSTVAELEAIVKSGGSIALIDLSKAIQAEKQESAPSSNRSPSLRDQLEDGKRQVAAQQGASAARQNRGEILS